jgi:hypothetical protein
MWTRPEGDGWFVANRISHTRIIIHHHRAGVVLTLYSNQQTFDSLDSVQDSVNRATDYGVEYAERLINVRAAMDYCAL